MRIDTDRVCGGNMVEICKPEIIYEGDDAILKSKIIFKDREAKLWFKTKKEYVLWDNMLLFITKICKPKLEILNQFFFYPIICATL